MARENEHSRVWSLAVRHVAVGGDVKPRAALEDDLLNGVPRLLEDAGRLGGEVLGLVRQAAEPVQERRPDGLAVCFEVGRGVEGALSFPVALELARCSLAEVRRQVVGDIHVPVDCGGERLGGHGVRGCSRADENSGGSRRLRQRPE